MNKCSEGGNSGIMIYIGRKGKVRKGKGKVSAVSKTGNFVKG